MYLAALLLMWLLFKIPFHCRFKSTTMIDQYILRGKSSLNDINYRYLLFFLNDFKNISVNPRTRSIDEIYTSINDTAVFGFKLKVNASKKLIFNSIKG